MLIVEPFQERLAKEGVHLLQSLILTSLFFEEREVRPMELARTFQVSKSNLSHALRDLEKRGFLKRSLLEQDARAYLFSLTPLGKKKTLSLVKMFDQVETAFEKEVGVQITRDFVHAVNLL